jgi:serine protease Do
MGKEKAKSPDKGKAGEPLKEQKCPKRYKPWIFTLAVISILTIAWAVVDRFDVRSFSSLFDMLNLEWTFSKKSGQGKPFLSAAGVPEPVKGVQDSYHMVVDMVRPAVVSIEAFSNIPFIAGQVGTPATQFAGPAAGEKLPMSFKVGSGVIIDPRGFMLSNYHVIKGSKNLKATLYTPVGERKYDLRIIKKDIDTDFVVLRLLGEGTFPYAVLGNSDKTMTGDVVLAMGSPFGFEQTITSGIISNRKRNISLNGISYREMIQTDAPINRGNSGGPLVNMKGEVIGINTAIYTPTGSFSGIGFAIPANQAMDVLAGIVDFAGTAPHAARGQLVAISKRGRQSGNSFRLRHGKLIVAPHQYRGRCVECHPQLLGGILPNAMQQVGHRIRLAAGRIPVKEIPQLGASVIEVDSVIAKQFKLLRSGGVLVNEVIAGASAEKGGLARGDIIVRVDGRKIVNLKTMEKVLDQKKIGDMCNLIVIRNGNRKRLVVEVGRRSMPGAAAQIPMPAGPKEFEWMGSEFIALDPAFSMYEDGVKVGDVGGLLASAGFMRGDIIKGVNGVPINDMPSFIDTISGINKRNGFLFDIKRAGRPLYIVMR